MTFAKCRWYWGSHGCSLSPGHDGLHECRWKEYDDNTETYRSVRCSQQDPENGLARYWDEDEEVWGEWYLMEGSE